MRRTGVASGLIWCALAAAQPARAATFAELPFAAQPGVATCLRATGDPGELVRLGPAFVVVLHVGDAGPVRTQRLAWRRVFDCPAVAAADGAGILAGPVPAAKRTGEMRARLRVPGGEFGAPVRIGPATPEPGQPAAAIAPSGAAVVVWAERDTRENGSRLRVMAAQRQAGGGFGPAQALTPWTPAGPDADAHVAAAIDPAGRAVVAWSRTVRERQRESLNATVELATAEPGAGLGPVRVLEARVYDAAGPELAVAPDGHVLLAYSDGDRGFQVRERAPGAADFTPVATALAHGAPAVAVRSGGGAVVASQSSSGLVQVSTRAAAGTFGAPERIAPGFGDGSSFGVAEPELEITGRIPEDADNRRVRLALAPDGAAVLAFGRTPYSFGPARVRVATGTLTGGFGAAQRLGTALRSANGVAALRLAGGRAAAAWTDNLGGPLDIPRRGGRVHVAAEGAAAARRGPVPHVRISVPPGQRLYSDTPLRVRVRCDAPCDLRATASHRRNAPAATGDASLRHAGTAVLRLNPFVLATSPWSGRTTITVHAGPPGGGAVTRAHVRPRLHLRPPPRLAPPVGVRARRTPGGRVIVTWRTTVPARRATYLVQLRPIPREFDAGSFAFRRGRGRHSFRVVLEPRRSAHRIVVTAFLIDRPQRSKTVVVPVSG